MPRCKAKANSTGKRCARSAIAGAVVCRVHGGAAPQVKAKALERIKALVDPAIDRLDATIRDKDHPQSVLASRDILDRAGHKPVDKVETTERHTEDAVLLSRAFTAKQLKEMRGKLAAAATD
jgi:hypothetical protein